MWAYKTAEQAGLPHYRLGGLGRFKKRDIDAFLEKYRGEKK